MNAINIALLGVGTWGRNYARVLGQLSQFNLGWMFDPVRPTEALAGANWVEEAAEIFANADVEAVVIASSDSTHGELAVSALNAGKHVLVEKPLCLSYDELDRIQSAAARSSGRIMVGHLLRYQQEVEQLLALAKANVLGEVLEVRTVRTGNERKTSGTCAWWRLAPHDLSLLIELLGQPQAIRVQAFGHSRHAQLRFSSGAGATVECLVGVQAKRRSVDVTCRSGQLVFDDLSRPRLRCSGGFKRDLSPLDSSPLGSSPLERQVLHFARQLRRGGEFRTGLTEGAAVVRWLVLGERSLASGGAWCSFVEPKRELAS